MRHLNKQLEVNHHTLEHYLEEQSRQEQLRNRFDRFGLGLMIVCGLLGLFYTTTEAGSLFQRKQGASSAVLLAQQQGAPLGTTPISPLAAAGAVASAASARPAVEVVTIDGQTEAGQTLYFTIDSFHPEAAYDFQFGNGQQVRAEQREVAFAYERAGTYEVQLKVTFEGESQIAYSKFLTIR
ncbi:MAG: PKD domain-containing protein [Bacteroidota bacterium]